MIIIEQTLLDILQSKVKGGNSGKSFSGRNYYVNQGSASNSSGRSLSGFGQARNAASGETGSAVAQTHLGGNPVTLGAANSSLDGMGSSTSANISGDIESSAKSKGLSTTEWIIVGGLAIVVIIGGRYLYLEWKKEQKMLQQKANSTNPKS